MSKAKHMFSHQSSKFTLWPASTERFQQLRVGSGKACFTLNIKSHLNEQFVFVCASVDTSVIIYNEKAHNMYKRKGYIKTLTITF